MTKRTNLLQAIKSEETVYEVPMKNDRTILVKMGEVQREPINGRIIHFSLVQMPKGQLSQIDLPIRLKGIPIGTKKGGNLIVLRPELKVKGTPKSLPNFLEAHVKPLDIGDCLQVKDLKIKRGLEILEDPEEVIAICQAPVMKDDSISIDQVASAIEEVV